MLDGVRDESPEPAPLQIEQPFARPAVEGEDLACSFAKARSDR